MRIKILLLHLSICLFLTLPFTNIYGKIPTGSPVRTQASFLPASGQSCHDAYKKLIDILILLKRQGYVSYMDIMNVHTYFFSNLDPTAKITTERLIAITKDMYNEGILTEDQYRRVIELLQN